MKISQWLPIALIVLGCIACSRSRSQAMPAAQPVELDAHVSSTFRFVTYGDARFHDPNDTAAANPAARVTLVQAIAQVRPAFICFAGDIVYNGYDVNDWKIWDSETSIWREKGITVYPALGNHDLHGNENLALGNYFGRFPDLRNSLYYSVRAGNSLILVLDSALDETSGPQGEWLANKLDNASSETDFIFVLLHHPPYTSSSDANKYGGGHSVRAPEQALGGWLEARQQKLRARIVVFSGHVHNYERHEHGGVTYFVTGGAGAHAYPIQRDPEDPFQSKEVNYHYLLVEVQPNKLKITMHRLDLSSGKASWTEPDSIIVTVAPSTPAKAAAGR